MFTIPNLTSLSRLILWGPLTAIFCFYGQLEVGFAFFAVAVMTDILDGWIARQLEATSTLGSVLDWAADAVTWIPLVLISLSRGWTPSWSLNGIVLGITVKKIWPPALPSLLEEFTPSSAGPVQTSSNPSHFRAK